MINFCVFMPRGIPQKNIYTLYTTPRI